MKDLLPALVGGATPLPPNKLLPVPLADVVIRPGVLADVPFLDRLQKLHTKQVGWMPTKQFEGKIESGHVLVAEEKANVVCGKSIVGKDDAASSPQTTYDTPQSLTPVGYCIGNDRYFKRDDVGVIYQMNVLPGRQRSFVGAALLRALFDRSAYGCKLYCCWCAQDIAANRFWEAMGFVPLAFRTGSEKKGPQGRSRVHIFWQKRIREGDVTTPWWFPSQTGGGSIREDRIVLPIPPGTHWSDAKPLVLPGDIGSDTKALPDDAFSEGRPAGGSMRREKPARQGKKPATPGPADGSKEEGPPRLRGLYFAPPPSQSPPAPPPAATAQRSRPARAKPARKNDPRLVAAARELRDRWLDEVNAGRAGPTAATGKYALARDVSPPATLPAGAPVLPMVDAMPRVAA